MPASSDIEWQQFKLGDCLLVRLRGELNQRTYRRVGDTLVKLALDEPRALIVVVDGLRVPAETALTVFTAASVRVSEWPGVPIFLVVGSTERRRPYLTGAIRRFVPVFSTVGAALAAVDSPPLRRLVRTEVAPVPSGSAWARRIVRNTCARWSIPGLRADAELLGTELVENAIRHGTGVVRLRLEWRHDMLTVAVYDSNPEPAVLREPKPGEYRLGGLWLVAQLAARWGCAPDLGGGKVVWAVLTGDLPRGVVQ